LMSRRQIGQGSFGFAVDGGGRHSSLDDLSGLIDWMPIEHRLAVISCAAKGEPAWPPLALFISQEARNSLESSNLAGRRQPRRLIKPRQPKSAIAHCRHPFPLCVGDRSPVQLPG
jgi:hypothetical protein